MSDAEIKSWLDAIGQAPNTQDKILEALNLHNQMQHWQTVSLVQIAECLTKITTELCPTPKPDEPPQSDLFEKEVADEKV